MFSSSELSYSEDEKAKDAFESTKLLLSKFEENDTETFHTPSQ